MPMRVEIGHELAGVGEPGFLRLCSGILAATKATPPAPRTTPVGLPLASFSIVPFGGLGVVASILAALSAARVEVAVADRPPAARPGLLGAMRSSSVEREAARLVGELLLRPAAEHRDPFAGLGGAHALGQHLERLLCAR